MKNCKSLVAVALALAVCIGSFVGISPAEITASAAEAQASENLIQNGGFEDEALGNWIIDTTNTNCAAVFTDQANSGTHSLKMATVKADGADSTVKQTIAVKERTNYSLSYYVYSEGDNWYDNGTGNKASQMKYSVMTTGDSPTTIGTGTFQATGSNRWKFTLVTLTFNSGDNTSLDIVFDLANNGPYNSISGSGFSFFCIDDVSVTETGNLILNGSFDEGTFVKQAWGQYVGSFGPWKIHWDVEQDTAAGHADDGETDTNSITIREYGENTSNAMNYISQQFYVKQNTSYKLTFWAKSSTADVPYKAIISNQGETSATNSAIPSARITYKTQANAAADTWEQFELEFNSGDNTVLYLYITGAYKDNSLGVKTNIDDVSIVEYTAEDGENSNLITDGDFEGLVKETVNNVTQFGAWKTGFAYGANVDTSEYHGGRKALKLLYANSKSNNFYVYQQIKVKKNTGYKLTFWYKSTETLACEVVTEHGFTYPYAESDSILAHKVVGTLNDSAPEWKEVTLNFNSGDNETLYVQFDANALDNGVSDTNYAYIDDVSIVEYTAEDGENSNLITDGDFENISKVTESGNNNYAAFGAWETGFAYGANLNASEYRSGSQSLKLLHERSNSSNFYVYQQISVEKNTAYKLTFWYKSNETLACEVVTKHGFTYPYAESDIILAHTVAGTLNDSAPEWTEVTLNFNSGDNETLYVQFDANALGNTVKADTHYVYIDDVSVVGYIKGDVDMNGSIGATDLTTMRKILLGIEIDNSNAKVNNDEGIDIRDLIALKKLLCGPKADN